MVINFKKLNTDAITPLKATDGSNGFDLTAISKKLIYDGKGDLLYIEYDTGIGFEIPSGYVGLGFSRSSVSKMGLALCNGTGVIDTDYRGAVSFRFYETSKNVKHYMAGDRVGQIVFLPAPRFVLNETKDLNDTQRGSGGYGSSGV